MKGITIPSQLIKQIHQNIMVLPPGVLYCKRLDSPTKETIQYTIKYLIQESTDHQTPLLIWDIRNCPVTTGGIQLSIVQQIPKLYGHFDQIAVVWDDTDANSWKKTFIAKLPVFRDKIKFSFHTSMEEAMISLQRLRAS